MSFQVLAILFLSQLPVNVPRKGVDDDFSTWAPATHIGTQSEGFIHEFILAAVAIWGQNKEMEDFTITPYHFTLQTNKQTNQNLACLEW